MNSINYLSDIKLLENYPKTDNFVYHYTTDEETCYDVSLELGNCRKEGDYLVICLDHHGLKEGQLIVRREFHFPDDDFPDKEWTKITEHRYDIYLTEGIESEPEQYVLPLYMPIFRGEKGEKGDAGDISDDQIDEIVTKVVEKVDWEALVSGKQDKLNYLHETEGFGLDVTYHGNGISSYVTVNEFGSSISAADTSSGESRYVGNVTVDTEGVKVETQGDHKFTYNGVEVATKDIVDGYSTKGYVDDAINRTTSYLNTKKQDKLESGVTIKTINGESILGSGNIVVQGGGTSGVQDVLVDGTSVVNESGYAKILLEGYYQPLLESGTNIKTINGNSILSGGNIELTSKYAFDQYKTTVATQFSEVNDKIEGIELVKVPNLTIFGDPNIENGQMSGFNKNDYAQFPFMVDLGNKDFEINLCITHVEHKYVGTQQNIFDSNFGLALAIRNQKFVLAYSKDGFEWSGEFVSSNVLSNNTTYYLKLHRENGFIYLESTVDKEYWVTEITIPIGLSSIASKQIVIGKSLNSYLYVDGEEWYNYFMGIINLNYCNLSVGGREVWQGMDDVGLSTRLTTDLSNLDDGGKRKINSIFNDNINGLISIGYLVGTDQVNGMVNSILNSRGFATTSYVDSQIESKIGSIDNILKSI